MPDVVIYCVSMANAIDIDLSASVLEKLEYNKRKYPKNYTRAELTTVFHENPIMFPDYRASYLD